MGVTQKTAGLLHLPLLQQLADVGGGYGDAVQLYPSDDVAANAKLGTQPFQLLGISLTLIAKMVIMSRYHMGRPVILHQNIGDKLLPGHLHHGAVKVKHFYFTDIVTAAHQPFAIFFSSQQQGIRPVLG